MSSRARRTARSLTLYEATPGILPTRRWLARRQNGYTAFVSADPVQRHEAIAHNEARFREHNERVKESNATYGWVDPPVPDWSCECGWQNCKEPVRLSVDEYEAVRANATHFLVVPDEGHVAPGAERVAERHARYWVVEKVGVAAALAVESDPRADDD